MSGGGRRKSRGSLSPASRLRALRARPRRPRRTRTRSCARRTHFAGGGVSGYRFALVLEGGEPAAPPPFTTILPSWKVALPRPRCVDEVPNPHDRRRAWHGRTLRRSLARRAGVGRP